MADGARWIWEESAMHFAGASEVLDIYHGLEHLGTTAKVLYGDGSAEGQTWINQGCRAILTGGWPAICQHLIETKQTTSKRSHRKSLKKLSGYLYRNSSRLRYAERLAEGRAIGSGQAEGACKHMIGRRLKQTGARWRVRHVVRASARRCADPRPRAASGLRHHDGRPRAARPTRRVVSR